MILEPMSILGWILIGAIAGWLAGKIVAGNGFGFVGNLVIGIIGACIGGLVLPQLGIIPASTLGNLIARRSERSCSCLCWGCCAADGSAHELG